MIFFFKINPQYIFSSATNKLNKYLEPQCYNFCVISSVECSPKLKLAPKLC
jgi:hypothetical protein